MLPFFDGQVVVMRPGNHFDIALPTRRILNIECTADDLSIVDLDGTVLFTCPLSPADHERSWLRAAARHNDSVIKGDAPCTSK